MLNKRPATIPRPISRKCFHMIGPNSLRGVSVVRFGPVREAFSRPSGPDPCRTPAYGRATAPPAPGLAAGRHGRTHVDPLTGKAGVLWGVSSAPRPGGAIARSDRARCIPPGSLMYEIVVGRIYVSARPRAPCTDPLCMAADPYLRFHRRTVQRTSWRFG